MNRLCTRDRSRGYQACFNMAKQSFALNLGASGPKLGQIAKKPPEIRFLKIREIDNSLKLFECVEHAVTGNGNYVSLQKFAWKNS